MILRLLFILFYWGFVFIRGSVFISEPKLVNIILISHPYPTFTHSLQPLSHVWCYITCNIPCNNCCAFPYWVARSENCMEIIPSLDTVGVYTESQLRAEFGLITVRVENRNFPEIRSAFLLKRLSNLPSFRAIQALIASQSMCEKLNYEFTILFFYCYLYLILHKFWSVLTCDILGIGLLYKCGIFI